MAVFSLGAFTFFSSGQPGDHSNGPATLQASGVTLQRPGVPGGGHVQHGIQLGVPFEFETMVDLVGRATAIVRDGQYRATVNGTPLKLIWSDTDYDVLDMRFLVRQVSPPKIQVPAALCGGITPNSNTWLTSRWTLQAVPL